ncbi:MAG: hypothetical protein U0T56_01760 [Ferruginibacter sp.]
MGFGTRYAGGCTSGRAIMGLSTFNGLHWWQPVVSWREALSWLT